MAQPQSIAVARGAKGIVAAAFAVADQIEEQLRPDAILLAISQLSARAASRAAEAAVAQPARAAKPRAAKAANGKAANDKAANGNKAPGASPRMPMADAGPQQAVGALDAASMANGSKPAGKPAKQAGRPRGRPGSANPQLQALTSNGTVSEAA